MHIFRDLYKKTHIAMKSNVPSIVRPVCIRGHVENLSRQSFELVIVNSQRALYFISSRKVLEEIRYSYDVQTKSASYPSKLCGSGRM